MTMKEEPVDPRMEKLVASLYKELSPAEERELEAQLERDPELRAEWDDLVSTRSMFGAWELEEKVPSFVFVDPAPSRRSEVGLWEGVRQRFGGFFAVSGWAVAAAAILVMVLAVKGYRIEEIDGGYAIRQAPRNNSAPGPVDPVMEPRDQAERDVAPDSPIETPDRIIDSSRDQAGREPNVRERQASDVVRSPSPVQLVNGNYVTEQEFEEKSTAMLRMFAELMNDYRARRDVEMAAMLRNMYGQLNDKQFADYSELRGRIEAVGLGLMAEQSRTNSRIEDIFEQTGTDSLAPAEKSPDGTEDE
jgi:hypothetical protein